MPIQPQLLSSDPNIGSLGFGDVHFNIHHQVPDDIVWFQKLKGGHFIAAIILWVFDFCSDFHCCLTAVEPC